MLVFLPQIMILFFFIAVLKDLWRHGPGATELDGQIDGPRGPQRKSLIPLLSSFACPIPGAMATRVIENRRDRLTTILVAPLMSCSARLPVYRGADRRPSCCGAAGWAGCWDLAGADDAGHVPGGHGHRGAVRPWALKPGRCSAARCLRSVMELPSYKWPSPRLVVLADARTGLGICSPRLCLAR